MSILHRCRAMDLYGKSKGEPREPIDFNAEYRVDGNKVVVTHADGSNTHRWSADGETRRLRFE